MIHHATPDRPFPTVQLRHELPDGSNHVDWMLGQDPDGKSPLLTFRMSHSLEALKSGQGILIEQIGAHRPAYLDYEGPVSGDRGLVRRLAKGQILEWIEIENGWELCVQWNQDKRDASNPCRYRLIRGEASFWNVSILA